MKHIAILRGSSATGKGTRMSQLLLFLQSLYYSETVEHTYISGNKRGTGKLRMRPYGIRFPELNNTVFIGYWCKSRPGGQMFWQSMDGFVRNTFTKDDCVEQLQEIFEMYSIVVDIHRTAGTGVGEFLKHENIIKYFDRVMYNRFFHTCKEDYIERISGRNGENRGGKSGSYSGFTSPQSEMKKYKEDAKHFRDGDFYELIDARVDYLEFGREYLKFIGLDNLVNKFQLFSQNYTTKRTIGVANDTIDNIKEIPSWEIEE